MPDETIKDAETQEPAVTEEAVEEIPKPKRRGRRPKAEIEAEAAAAAAKAAEVAQVAESVKTQEPEVEEAPKVKVAPETKSELTAEPEVVEPKIEVPKDVKSASSQIQITASTPLYRGPGEQFKIRSVTSTAIVLGQVGKFTKIQYVRHGLGVQEGYVILDEKS